MPKNHEPPIVTMTKMSDHIAARTAETQQALEAATDEAANAWIEAEREGAGDGLRRLARAEKRRDSLAADLERLRTAQEPLNVQLIKEREAGELDLLGQARPRKTDTY